MSNAEDEWGDEEDEAQLESLMIQATQMAEEDEKKRMRDVIRSGNADSHIHIVNDSDGKRLSPALANTLLTVRRENLPVTKPDDVESLDFSSMTQNTGLKKLTNEELHLKLQAALGEAQNLRKKFNELRQQMQLKSLEAVNKDRTIKQKYESTLQQIRKELEQKTRDLSAARDEIVNLKTKPPSMVSTSVRLSVGGAGAANQSNSSSNSSWVEGKKRPNQTTLNVSSTTTTTKARSDPNLVPLPQNSPGAGNGSYYSSLTPPKSVSPRSPQSQHWLMPNTSPAPARKGVENTTQAEFAEFGELLGIDKKDELVFKGEEVVLGELDSLDNLKLASLRKKIVQNLDEIVDLEYAEVEPTLLNVIDALPSEIKIKYDMKGKSTQNHCFQEINEALLRHCNDIKRKEDRMKRGVSASAPSLKIPIKHDSCLIDLTSTLRTMKTAFLMDGPYAALSNIKKSLMKLLAELTREKRLRLFEVENMRAYWTLLAWAKHLWKFIIFEEEIKTGITEEEKKLWIDGLQAWTGLVLKADWRDLYFPKLEAVVRGLSLNILESIVVAGYFEQSQRRYEILYSIIKDTLLKDHLRTHVMVRQCLVIITWGISNRTILKYLCFNLNNGNCLAQLVGENVLKCFMETKDPYDATNLLVCYLNLLEALMLKDPFPKPASSFALSKAEKEEKEKDLVKSKQLMAMEEDTPIFSQFACQEKYKFEEGSKARAAIFDDAVNIDCWINPKEWELEKDHRDSDTKKCQCRKFLLGNVFAMIRQVIDFWKISFRKRMECMEEDEISDWKQLQKLEFLDDPDSLKEKEDLQVKLDSIRKFVTEKMGEVRPMNKRRELCVERTWEEILNADVLDDIGQQLLQKDSVEKTSASHLLKWISEKKMPENVFDYVLCRGIYLICFCKHFSKNLALAIGSSSFAAMHLLQISLRFYAKELLLSDVERQYLESLDEAEDDINGAKTFRKVRLSMVGWKIDEEDLGLDEDFDGVILPEFDREFVLNEQDDIDWSEPPDMEEANKWFRQQFKELRDQDIQS